MAVAARASTHIRNRWRGDPERGCVFATFRRASAGALGPSDVPIGEMAAAHRVPVGSNVEAPRPDGTGPMWRLRPPTPGAARARAQCPRHTPACPVLASSGSVLARLPLTPLWPSAGTDTRVVVVTTSGVFCQEVKLDEHFQERGTAFLGFQLLPKVPRAPAARAAAPPTLPGPPDAPHAPGPS